MHRTTRGLPLALFTAALAACGSNSSGPGAGFECIGQPLPTTAPAGMTFTGQTKSGLLTQNALSGVEVIVSRTGTDTVGADTSTASGLFSITFLTGGTPVDGHLQLKKSGYLSAYAYPSRPLVANDSVGVLLITSSEFAFVAGAAGVTPVAGDGFIGVVVKNPAGTVKYNVGGAPSSSAVSTSADGVAYIANVAAGNVTVMATAGGNTLRQHVVNARADAITLTEIQP